MRSSPWAPLPKDEGEPHAVAKVKIKAWLWFMTGAALLALLSNADAADSSTELRFARHGKPIATRDLSWFRDRLGSQLVQVHEPYESDLATFRAFRLNEVLDAVYSTSWRKEEEVLFTCRDGYQPSVPVARLLAHRAWLAFARTEQSGFSILRQLSGKLQTVQLGPYYIVWENLDDPLIRQEYDYGWPYQLLGIDLVRQRDRFGKMAPPADASDAVQAGFAAFRVHCSKCHKVNGEGGDIGPQLNAALLASGRLDRDRLETWIKKPASLLPNTRMPSLNPDLPERDRTVNEIIAYLYAMAGPSRAAREE